jgi:hypothetical protein
MNADNEFLMRLQRKDWLFAGLFFALVFFSRIPFAGQYLFHSDSTRFALAMEHFDVSQMRPQAPGYILYVGVAKLVDFFLRDAAKSLVAISMISNALTVCILYFLALKMFGRSSALISAVLLATSPLFWYNGDMALAYALEGLLATSFAYACYMLVCEANIRTALAAAVLLAAATGTRQNVVILLAPLWIFALWKMPFRRVLASVLVFGICCLAWFVPLVILSGGLKSYLQTLNAQYQAVIVEPLPFLEQMAIRTGILARFIFYSFVLGLAPLVYFIGRFFDIAAIHGDVRVRFILLWMLPAVCFYVLITIWNPGQVILVLPPLILFLSKSLLQFSRQLSEICERNVSHFIRRLFFYASKLAPGIVTLVIAAVNIYIFLFANTPVSYAAIRTGDRQMAEMILLTKENGAPDKTIILACVLNTQAAYYLPEYRVYCPFPLIFDQSRVPLRHQNVYISYKRQTQPRAYWIDMNFNMEPIDIPDGIDRLMLWEPQLADYYQGQNRPLVHHRKDRSNDGIFSLHVNSGERIVYGFHAWSLQ